jgi:integrase
MSNHKNHDAYRNFMLSLKSDYTRRTYSFYFFRFLSSNEMYSNLTLDEILKISPKDLERSIISTMVRMKEEENLSTSSTGLLLASLTHFFSINDVVLNRKKIYKFVGERENKFEYRSYTHDEISRLLSLLDERGKAAVLLLASTGMRVGGLVEIRLKHLQKWKIDDPGIRHVYKIIVYARSSRHRYITFCSPEAAEAIDDYLEMRKRHGENLTQDKESGNWTPGETPLIIRQFNKSDFTHKILPIQPKSIAIKIIVPKLHQLGIRKKISVLDSTGTKRAPALNRHELHPCHSLRIFAITQMQRAKLDKTIREMLVDHSVGLDSVYYKPQEEEILEEYLKAVDLLTISKEHRLQKQLDHYNKKSDDLQLVRTQITENYEQKIQLIREEMESKFKQFLTKVDIQKLQ